MKKNIAVYGLLAAAFVSLVLIFSAPAMIEHCGSPWLMVSGFGSMLLAFSLMIPAIKTYRDRQGAGAISFGKAFGIGAGIALIASVFYTLTWVILYKNFYPDFVDRMEASQLTRMTQQGKSAKELAEARSYLQEIRAAYSTWAGLIGYTILEILPLGVLVALITGLVMKRKPRPTWQAGRESGQA